MKKKHKESSYYENDYIFDNFVNNISLDDNYNNIEWGKKDHCKIKKVKMKNKDLVIKNRFDFGNDANLLIKNTKENKRKLPNIFNLAKNKTKNV